MLFLFNGLAVLLQKKFSVALDNQRKIFKGVMSMHLHWGKLTGTFFDKAVYLEHNVDLCGKLRAEYSAFF